MRGSNVRAESVVNPSAFLAGLDKSSVAQKRQVSGQGGLRGARRTARKRKARGRATQQPPASESGLSVPWQMRRLLSYIGIVRYIMEMSTEVTAVTHFAIYNRCTMQVCTLAKEVSDGEGQDASRNLKITPKIYKAAES